ncbi:3-deoxy-D-manno-octulosonic acid transferase [Roseovarius sp. 2305UL8-3]|uniref:3-deoxy-D-manno-octulosonic acid transferase n=1 Tax=Roseovarius conchicola TaxID=3121636 RepID=UPI0035289202
MSRSLSLAAYMAYARRASVPQAPPDLERPEGELVWAHAADATRAEALCQIAERLWHLRPGLTLILTAAEDVAQPARNVLTVIWTPLPEDTVASVETFLDHWRPDICLWTGGDLRPALLNCADQRDIPLYLIDADEVQLDRPGWRWFPDLPRSLLKSFAQIQARSEEAARALRRIGVPDEDISITGALRAEAIPLPFNETEREELAQTLRGRPVWLAARLHLNELETVLEARRQVSRLSHRLVLMLTPEEPEDAPKFKERLEDYGLRTAIWADSDWPEETTQVILGDTAEDLGLWYRVAPVTFLGGSLFAGMHGHDPNEPAVHGSAILYGPNVRSYLTDYSRYAEARAARIVRDADTMAAAVQALIAPDQAAAMAHAAWDVASQGAEVTDSVLDLVQDTLDIVGAG